MLGPMEGCGPSISRSNGFEWVLLRRVSKEVWVAAEWRTVGPPSGLPRLAAVDCPLDLWTSWT